jgi:hypothetical protein
MSGGVGVDVVEKFRSNETNLLRAFPVEFILYHRVDARAVVAVGSNSIVYVIDAIFMMTIIFDDFRWSLRPQRKRFDSSETLSDEVRTAVGHRSVAEDVAVADRVEEWNRASVVSTRAALLYRACRTVAVPGA